MRSVFKIKPLIKLLLLLALVLLGDGRDSHAYYRTKKKKQNTGFSYPGGKAQFYKDLREEVGYPKKAIRKKQQGVVLIEFIVETDGDLSEINILQSAGKVLDKKSIKALKKVGKKFKPHYENGEAIRVAYTVPMVFDIKE